MARALPEDDEDTDRFGRGVGSLVLSLKNPQYMSFVKRFCINPIYFYW